MSNDRVTSSPVRRLLRLGSLVGRVGTSVAGEQLMALARSRAGRDERRTENLVRNATRIVETLGELKGAAMKVGQMLSLHDAILPPEVAAVLRTLQKQAPPLPHEVVQDELALELPQHEEIFARFELEAFAAASIGQVHRAILRDGREVAVKLQYPLIDRIVEADLGNLRLLLQTLFSLVSDVDFEPVWQELRDRLMEELDYLHEAENIRRMATLHAEVPEIIIPGVIDEATTRRVLTMEYVPGIPPDEACSETYDQGLKDRWGTVLMQFLLRGMLEHGVLHADPNLSNFAFREDGRVVVYDFGCVKEVPPAISAGYRDLARGALSGDGDGVLLTLRGMGVVMESGELLPRQIVDPYVELFGELFRVSPPFRFGEDSSVYQRLLDLGLENVGVAKDARFPHDLVFINRSIGGHFGNFSRLKAAGPWRELLLRHSGTT